VDLVLALGAASDVAGAVRFLGRIRPAPPSGEGLAGVVRPGLRLLEFRPLRSARRRVVQYVKARGFRLDEVEKHLGEALYTHGSGPQAGKQFFGLGWMNQIGGVEIRAVSGAFKAVIGLKAPTMVPGDGRAPAVVTEGFLDLLAARALWPAFHHGTGIALNGVGTTRQLEHHALDGARLLLDADAAGSAATRDLLRMIPAATDLRGLLNGQQDAADLLRARRQGRGGCR
jgi:hypothetical protein